MSDPGRPLRSGWTIRIPAATAEAAERAAAAAHPEPDHAEAGQASSREVIVRPDDTLSGIAAAHGIKDWHEIWPENEDRPEPGGRHFTDPDLILPGWTVEIPEHAAPPAAPPVTAHPPVESHGSPRHASDPPGNTEHHQPTVAPTANPPHAAPPAKADDAQPGRHGSSPARLHAVPPATEDHPGATASSTPLNTEPAVTAHQLGAGAPAATSETATAAGPSPRGTGREDSAVVSMAEWTLSIGAGAGLLAGMLYSAMRVARRRRLRHRRPGRYLSALAPEHVPLEQTLVTEGAVAQRDVVFIDHALRSLAADLAAADGRLPAIVAARLTGEHLDLVLAGPQLEPPPAPWVAVTPTSWAIAKSADLPSLSELRAHQAAPYPTLVSVGCTPAGEEWLVDLEQAGAIAFDGDPDRCLDLVRFIVAELAYNPWSDQLLVTVAGFGSELVALNPDQLIHTDDITAAATIATRTVEVNREVADSHHIDVLHGRLHGISGDAWMPQVLVVAPDWAEQETDGASVDRLLATVGQRQSRSAVAVVLAGDRTSGSPAGLRLTVQPDGTLLIPDLGVSGAASQLPGEQAAALAEYFTAERNGPVDVPIPASQRTTGSAAFADAAGALRAEFKTLPRPAAGGESSTVIDLTVATSLPVVGAQEQAVPGQGEDIALGGGLPRVDTEVTAAVVASEPTLDADLADWYDPDCPRPKFDLLGPIGIHAKGVVPTKSLPLTVEAMLYVLLHPRGVTGDRFANDLWPKMNYTYAGSSTPRAVMTAARKWAGADPVTGSAYLVEAKASKAVNGVGLYRFDGALDSVDLFQRLRTRGEARGEHGLEDLMAALRLVTGVPLSCLRPLGGAWLTHTDVSSDGLSSAIADVADVAATAALAAGSTALAREAAQVAVLAEVADDRALLTLAACAERDGRRAELTATVRRIMTHHDDELDNEDPPDETIEILRRNGWLELLSAG